MTLLLLLLLLAISGRALAAPCAEEAHGHETPVAAAMDMQGEHCRNASGQDHCHSQGDHGKGADCDQGCDCCPGHCAAALPASGSQPAAATGGTPPSTYTDLNSDPCPEGMIRPPQSR